MSIWTRIVELPEEFQQQVYMLYNDQFPIEMRTSLADWFEVQQWYNYSNITSTVAFKLFEDLMKEFSVVVALTENIALKIKLEQILQSVQITYSRDPTNYIRLVCQCLSNERKILHSAQNFVNNMDIKPTIRSSFNNDIYQAISKLRNDLQECDQILRRLNQEQEQLILNFQERQKFQTVLTASQHTLNTNERNKQIKQIEQRDANLHTSSVNLNKERDLITERWREILNRLERLQATVLDVELEKWRRGQQLAGNGVAYEGTSIDEIQDWCEGLAELLWQTRILINRMKIQIETCSPSPYITEHLYRFLEKTSMLLVCLVKSTFVIEKQPPQVMKTNTRFTATVRLLIGSKLNVHMTPPQVNVFIVSEHQVSSFAGENNAGFSSHESAAGEILNNTGMMEYHQATRQLSAHFRNMQLKKIKRTEKKGTESVMDEKFALLFFSRINICGGELSDISVRIFSLPVVVIVHGNQEPHAHATITWDNAFAEPRRTSFAVPDKVPFIRVGEVLSQKFISFVGRGLSEENLRFLAAKALRVSNVSDLSSPISWSQFSKESLPDRAFTFWEWFYAILKVTKEHLRNCWNDNTIYGFVWRKQTEEMLFACKLGTFLLRFSDSELGGLTVAVKGKTHDGTADDIVMLQPFTAKDFSIRSLADRLNDLKQLNFLYPDIPKSVAFSKYYSPVSDNQKTTTGYVKPVLVTCVPSLSGPSYDSCPNTPQSTMHAHSPGDSPSMNYDTSNSQMDMACTPVKNGVQQQLSTEPEPPYEILMSQLMQQDNNISFPINFSSHNLADQNYLNSSFLKYNN